MSSASIRPVGNPGSFGGDEEECLYSSAGDCPVTATLEVIGGKWKPIILWLLSKRTRRFSEIRRNLPTITQKMLTQQLRELELDGIIHREVYPQVPPKVEYRLTRKGKSFVPVIAAIREWGERNLGEPVLTEAAE